MTLVKAASPSLIDQKPSSHNAFMARLLRVAMIRMPSNGPSAHLPPAEAEILHPEPVKTEEPATPLALEC
jgi:hypothetical protein